MKTCKDLLENIDLYLNQDLGMWQALWFYLHLLLCKSCRAIYSSYKIIINESKNCLVNDLLSEEEAQKIVSKIVALNSQSQDLVKTSLNSKK